MPKKRFDLVGIGVSVWDRICLVASLPARGSVVRAQRVVEGIGGGVTVAVAMASRLGSRTAMIDHLGDDFAGQQILQRLRDEGVDVDGTEILHSGTSSVASIWSEIESAERTIVFSPGTASDQFSVPSDLADYVSNAKLLHLNGRHLQVCNKAIELAKQTGTLVSFDGGAFRYRDEVIPLMRAADLVIVARQFAECHAEANGCSIAADMTGLELAESLQCELKCRLVGVTSGAGGSYFVTQDGHSHFQPAMDAEKAIDTTGCGDTFHGAFLHRYLSSEAVAESAAFAAFVAGKNAQDVGGLVYRPES